MSDVKALLPQGAVDSQSARASATNTTGEAEFGAWWLQAANIGELIAESDQQWQFGRIRLTSAGWVQINLKDNPGWHPFASVAGIPAGRRMQLTTRYGFADGSIREENMPMTYDSTTRRFIAVGPISDGTLQPNALQSRILVAAIDVQDWQLDDLVFGWVKLGDD